MVNPLDLLSTISFSSIPCDIDIDLIFLSIINFLYFVLLRSKPKIPAFGTTGFGALLTGIFGLFFIDLNDIFIGNLVAISVSGLIILPFSFAALTYATRYTIAANISLLMLLETILGPVWVWFFLKETPGIQMVMGGIIVIFSLGIYFLKLQRD